MVAKQYFHNIAPSTAILVLFFVFSLHLFSDTLDAFSIHFLACIARLIYSRHPIDLISIATIHVELIEIVAHHNFIYRDQFMDYVWKACQRKEIDSFRLEFYSG